MASNFDEGDKMRRWAKALENSSETLRAIGLNLVGESGQAFKAQKFGKEKWAPRAVPNVFGIISDFSRGRKEPKSHRFDSRPALEDTGRLKADVKILSISLDTVEVGSRLPYAGKMHHGGPTESETVTEKVQELLWKWLKRQPKAMKQKLGWLLNEKYTDEKIPGRVPARPFLGFTEHTADDIDEIIAGTIFEVE